MLELVRGYATATLDSAEGAGKLDGVAAGLEAIARLLVSSETLRGVVTDPSIPADARQAVVEDLLKKKVPEEALGPFVFAILEERASELPKTLERLLEMAETARARNGEGQPPGAEPPIGRSGSYERIRGFGDRIFEHVSTRDVDVLEDELFRLARLAEGNVAFREAMADSRLPIEHRLSVLAELLKNKVRRETAALAAYVMRAGRSRDLVGGLDHLVEIAAAERGRRVAHVRAARELNRDERDRLGASLSRSMRRPVELRVRIDPSVIGGVSVSVGDIVIDGTVRHRLDQLRESFLQRA